MGRGGKKTEIWEAELLDPTQSESYRRAMTEQSGDSDLDAVIDEFLYGAANTGWWSNKCGPMTAMFESFLKTKGIAFEPVGGSADEFYPDRTQEGNTGPHVLTKVKMPSGTYLVDFTARQFGQHYTFPMVQRLNGNERQRQWSSAMIDPQLNALIRQYLAQPEVKACETPHGAFGQCKAISFNFADLAKGAGYPATVINLSNASGMDWEKMDRRWYGLRGFETHYVAQVGDLFIDFTARQFDPSAPFPAIWSREELESQWEYAYDKSAPLSADPLWSQRTSMADRIEKRAERVG